MLHYWSTSFVQTPNASVYGTNNDSDDSVDSDDSTDSDDSDDSTDSDNSGAPGTYFTGFVLRNTDAFCLRIFSRILKRPRFGF